MADEYQDLLFARENGVAIITLNRPERLNAVSMPMVDSLLRALAEVRADSNVRCLVVTGVGRGFCSGMDVGFQRERQSWSPSERVRWLLNLRFFDVPVMLRQMDKPSIAAINGVCVGAGLGLALACDIKIAAGAAQMGSVFIRRAMVPDDGVTYFLPRIVGTSKACEIMFSGDMVEAEEAFRIGLVNKVVPPDKLMPTALEMAAKIAKGPPIAMALTKRAIYKGIESDLQSQIHYEMYAQNVCYQTEDLKEGTLAFQEKRQPLFKGQ